MKQETPHTAFSTEDFSGHFSYDKIKMPRKLDQDYHIMSCLKYSEQSATYLLRQKSSGKTVLLKTSSDPLFSEALRNESEILEHIHCQNHRLAHTFPVSMMMLEEDQTCYYVRSYIEGNTLEELCETSLERPGMDPMQALDYAIRLAELLHFLHNMKPPLIHRDIKPQNVVVDSAGLCHFIDLGISRFYHKEKKSDTFIMGTRITAPPEQFGYQQTDMRSDLYSLGILLLYCITGEYEVSLANLEELDASLRFIIQKATMFDPDKRYQSTDQLLTDLLDARYAGFLSVSRRQIKIKQRLRVCRITLGVLLAVNVCLAALLILGRKDAARQSGGDLLTSSSASLDAVYTFREPLIEEAARAALNKGAQEPVTYRDLASVTQLHIIGLQIYSDDSEIWFDGENTWVYDADMREAGLYAQQGTISSLEDIMNMPNLTTLCLYRQQISDISLLKDTAIRQLGIGYNPLTDLSPLEGNTSIRSLNAACLDLSDTQVLSTLSGLQSLNISDTGIASLAGLEACPLETLNLFGLDLEDYGELQNFPALRDLTLNHMSQAILEQIQGIPVTDLEFSYSSNVSLDALSVLPNLETLYFAGDGSSSLIITAPQLPNLKDLTLVRTKVESFETMGSLESLSVLQIYGADCLSFDGLDLLPGLRHINCSQEQQSLIEEQFPERAFDFQLV